ncbi:MAG: hypothetical protein EPN50_05340, partial [Chloroflexota bacterium]
MGPVITKGYRMQFPSLRRLAGRAVLVRGAVATAALVMLAGLLSPALAATTTKPYSATASPASVSAGATVSGWFAITNGANPQTLGSANITLPSGLTVSGTSSDTGSVSVSGNVIQLRNLNLSPGATATVSFSLTAACGSSGGSWASVVKQSNAFNGPPGNDFSLSGTVPTTTVTGSCSLAF